MADVSVETLSKVFLQTLSPLPEPRRLAESYLSEASDAPGFAVAVLQIVAERSIDDQIRQSAVVHFKNHLRSRWAPLPPSDPSSLPLSPISDNEKNQIKSLIVPLMLASVPRIQSQLSEALAVISKHDFPKSWSSLLPELVSSLRSATDYASINGILGTINSIFKKFRYSYSSNNLLIDLKYCLDGFAAPLLEIFLNTSKVIFANLHNADTLKLLFESQRLCCRIFFSLNFQELPEFFEDHMNEWMTEFRTYLTTSYPVIEDQKKEGGGMSIIDELRSAICENISLYMEKNEEEFKDYLKDFATAVWNLLINSSASSSRERLTVTATKFLTTVSTSVHHTLFSSPETLQQICQSIVIPNIRFRDEDEELFEMNFVEYIRRDIEGSDLDTRRRIACELLKGLATHYREQVMSMISVQIQNMLGSFASNPTSNWKDKDCVIYLVVSLATKKSGGSSATTDIVDVESFFKSVIVPDLQSSDINALPVLKADALKFFTIFRSQISKSVALSLLPDVIKFLVCESNVVHSYAANCIEKLLLVKDDGRARYSSSDINPLVPILMTNLYNALKSPESQENQYIMKCIMRVFGVTTIGREVVGACISGLTSILGEVCKNPKNPVFNHYLFEAVAALVRRSCEHDPSLVSVFEGSLFPVLQTILANDITEFWPYAFQLLAQLVETNRPPIPKDYMTIFEVILSPETWKRSGNAPALVRLLQAYLQKAPQELNREGRLSQVLGIFNKLVSASSTDEHGFYVLNTVIENLSYDVLSPYVGHIWTVLFTRLQNQRTMKFVKSLVIFMSLFLVKHGHPTLSASINGIQPNLFNILLEQIWIPNLKLITGLVELKLTSVASTKLLCECPVLLDNSAALMWGRMLDSIITLLARPEQERVEEEPEVPDLAETVGYSASFARLYNAGKKEEDPLKEIKDPKEFLVSSLAKLSAHAPGKYPAIIKEALDPANQTALLQFCVAFNSSIV